MPIYEYRCEKCGDFERTQRITDAALQRCPTCRRKVRRLISNTSFQLKGSGWYVTDYARSGSKNGKGEGESAGTDAKADAGSPSSESPTKTESTKTESSKSESPKTPKPGKSARAAAKTGSAAKSGS